MPCKSCEVRVTDSRHNLGRQHAADAFFDLLKTPEVGSLSRDFLEQLHAAAQGISPLEYAETQTNRAKAAEAAFAAAHGNPKAERVKVLYPTKKRVDASKEQAGRHLIKWEGDKGLDDLQTGDLRKTVLRQLELKSGRLNGSAVRSLSFDALLFLTQGVG